MRGVLRCWIVCRFRHPAQIHGQISSTARKSYTAKVLFVDLLSPLGVFKDHSHTFWRGTIDNFLNPSSQNCKNYLCQRERIAVGGGLRANCRQSVECRACKKGPDSLHMSRSRVSCEIGCVQRGLRIAIDDGSYLSPRIVETLLQATGKNGAATNSENCLVTGQFFVTCLIDKNEKAIRSRV